MHINSWHSGHHLTARPERVLCPIVLSLDVVPATAIISDADELDGIVSDHTEAAIVGSMTYIFFGHSSESTTSVFGLGVVSSFNNVFLNNIETAEYEIVFVAAAFAAAAVTIISGAVLERMKNHCFVIWMFLMLLINYSFAAYWVWNPNGWLYKLGFVDCAGSVIIHGTGGIASIVAMYALGPRMHSVKR